MPRGARPVARRGRATGRSSTLSGGEQKRLALEALLPRRRRRPAARRARQLPRRPGQALARGAAARDAEDGALRQHDRELIARPAPAIVTVEARTALDARRRLRDVRGRRARRPHRAPRRAAPALGRGAAKLIALVRRDAAPATRNADMAGATRPRADAPARGSRRPARRRDARRQDVRIRLGGGRTGSARSCARGARADGPDAAVHASRSCTASGSACSALNGTGKSPLPAPPRRRGGRARAARAARRAGRARPLRADPRPPRSRRADAARRPDGAGGVDRSEAMAIADAATASQQRRSQRFETLSGGQQARLQILLLEPSGATLLLLDEPTDNLDLDERRGARARRSTRSRARCSSVTHDRWFVRRFDRFLVFRERRPVIESLEPVWDGLEPRASIRPRARSHGTRSHPWQRSSTTRAGWAPSCGSTAAQPRAGRAGARALENLEHRGATGADPETGDGAGILTAAPRLASCAASTRRDSASSCRRPAATPSAWSSCRAIPRCGCAARSSSCASAPRRASARWAGATSPVDPTAIGALARGVAAGRAPALRGAARGRRRRRSSARCT